MLVRVSHGSLICGCTSLGGMESLQEGRKGCEMLQWCYFVQVMNRNNDNALPRVGKNLWITVQKK